MAVRNSAEEFSASNNNVFTALGNHACNGRIVMSNCDYTDMFIPLTQEGRHT